MTTTEAAKLYGVSQRSIERWCSRDGLPHERGRRHGLGRLIALDRLTVLAWLRRRPWMLDQARAAKRRAA